MVQCGLDTELCCAEPKLPRMAWDTPGTRQELVRMRYKHLMMLLEILIFGNLVFSGGFCRGGQAQQHRRAMPSSQGRAQLYVRALMR